MNTSYFRDRRNSISSTTHLDEHKFYTTVSKGVKVEVKVGTYTSEIEGTLKCKSKNRYPYILLRVVCVHMVCAPQYCNYVYLLVVILIQLLVGNQIEHRMTDQLILVQLLSVS